MVHLISYDLDQHARPAQYAEIKRLIEQHAVSWAKPLYSQWLVETQESVDTWQQRLLQAMDQDDRLLVVQVRRPYQGWLAEEIWNWLNPKV